ncbi:MAG: hypothetical protein IE935_09260 [Micrococcales bacterium]|nr:hypothetical protein [Micrococcales bacterium]
MSDAMPGWADDPFLIAFTPLRRVTTRESPYAGTLVRSPAGVHLLIDPEQVPAGELFWTPQEDTHVLRALDVVHMGTSRSEASVGALVEACREPLETYLEVRDSLLAPVTEPECATIMISLLRGANELRAAASKDLGGAWWLSASARPVFALMPGAEPAAQSACRILNRLPLDDARGGSVRDAIVAVLRADDLRAGGIDACERAVFEWVEPGPLRPSSKPPAPVRLTPSPATVDSPLRAESRAVTPDEPAAFDRLVRGGDGGWHETLADVAASARGAMRSLRRRPRAERPVRRGRLVIAAVAVGVVLAVAVTVLTPDARTAPADNAPTGGGAPLPAIGEATSPDSGLEEESPDLSRVAGVILDAMSTCAGDAACVGTISERGDVAPAAGAATAPAALRTLHLVDEYGDVAVVRAEADSYPPQLVVIARHDDRWLLREVLDLTQQPSS